jgi:hypothetical protein
MLIIELDMEHDEYLKYKKLYPLRIDDKNNIYFENNTPYFSPGMRVGLPEELYLYRFRELCIN